MRRPGTFLAGLLIGSGVGAAAAAVLGEAVLWLGVLAALAGVVVWFAVGREASPRLGAPQPDRPGEDPPTLRGLGTRVEQVLQLAEQQADDHREAAQQDAERIVADARAEAESILNQARTGNRGPDAPPRG